mmetsp:Transcript_16662/g.30865  ORF Transcript_16662/g.30865 Transcript_16662/m.30865 type:complete len:285 (+) Transcript_16662:55-909(+)
MVQPVLCLGAGAFSLVLLLVIGFYAVSLFNKYSPVYKDISIGSADVAFDGLSVRGFSLNFNLDIQVMVTNPNAYDVKIESLRQGRVLLAPERTDVGSIETLPGMLPAGGQKKLPLKAVVELRGFAGISLISRFTRGPVHVYLEIDLEAVVEEFLLFTSIEIRPTFEKKCGVTLDTSRGISGGLACGDSFTDLKFCEINDPSCEGVVCLGTDCMSIDEEIIKDAESQRDLYLGLAMGLSFSFAFIVMCCSGIILAREIKRCMLEKEVGANCISGQVVQVGKAANS